MSDPTEIGRDPAAEATAIDGPLVVDDQELEQLDDDQDQERTAPGRHAERPGYGVTAKFPTPEGEQA